MRLDASAKILKFISIQIFIDNIMTNKYILEAYEYLMSIGVLHKRKDLADKIGSSESNVSRALNGNERFLTKGFIRRFNNSFNNIFNEEWLISGVGEMITKEEPKDNQKVTEDPYITTKGGTKYYKLPKGRFRMIVPFVPISAFAGYADNYCDIEYVEGLKEHEFVVDEIHHGKYYSFEIKGDSMCYIGRGSLYDGDIVLARELGKHHWRDELNISKYPVWIIVLRDTIICKQIIKHDSEKGIITCHSLNPSPEYQDFEISLDDVSQLLNVIKKESKYSL